MAAREDVLFVAHCIVMLGMMAVVRPLFTALVPAADYHAAIILQAMVARDVAALEQGARRATLVIPPLLFLWIPTLLVLFSKAQIGWLEWECGKHLRVFVMALLAMLCWSGATGDYNLYLDRGHGVDRWLLVGLTALCWRTPLAVPFATKWALVMLKESYVPIPQDDFDFRSIPEVLIVFSCFTWASVHKTFKSKHFLLLGLAAWASYYFTAGTAKLDHGPLWSWLLENHLSNLSVGAHVRGWLGFVSDDTFMRIFSVVRWFDRPMAIFVLVFELGALCCFFVSPRVAKLWLAMAFAFHLGVFVLTGIFFWKWMFCNAAFLVFLHKGGAPLIEQVGRHRLVVIFGMASVWFAEHRLWFNPQTHVVWYDSAQVDNFELRAVGASGATYVVDPSSLTPSEMHWVQGYICHASRHARVVTSIYGTTGSYAVMKAMEDLAAPADALTILRRGRNCYDARRGALYDDFLRRFFQTLNRRGRPWGLLDWVGRPTHLWIQPRGPALFDARHPSEPIVRIEYWREIVVRQGGRLHVLDEAKIHEVEIQR